MTRAARAEPVNRSLSATTTMAALLDTPLSMFSIPVVWFAQWIPARMRVRRDAQVVLPSR